MSSAMDVESKELLREWLVRSLEPVCDADPEVLSKYVLALIQNDPKKEGLRDTCVAKLDEFLGDETVPFVGRLFTALESESYRKDNRSRAVQHEDVGGRSGHSGRADDDHARHPQPQPHDGARRRPRGASDDEGDDAHARYGKQRRREDGSALSPRRGGADHRDRDDRRDRERDDRRHRGDAYGGRAGGRGRDWDRERGGGGGGGAYGPPGGDRRRNFPPEWGMPPPGMWPPPHAYPGGGPPHHMMGDFDPSAYNPEAMGMMMGGRGGGYYPPYGGRGRGGRGGVYHSGRGGGPGGPPGGPSPRGEDGGGAEATVAKTTLRVSNVDPKYVNMTKLSLHFSKFGNVVNVQMRPQHKCAYVQYASEEEAKKAFHSPMPVCNNRFIEVKWARYDPKDPQGAPSSTDESGDKKDATAGGDAASADANGDANGDAANGQAVAAAADAEAEAERNMTPEELRAAALEKGRRVLEEKRELLEKQKQLMKQKEELLKRQLAQQKELLERMSQNPTAVSAADKRELLNKITTLSEELKALQPQPQNKLSGLKAELSALEEAAASSGGAPFAGGRGRGRGGAAGAAAGGRWGAQQAGAGGRGFYGRGPGGRGGRGAGRVFSNTLDNRTTIVKVENLPEEARDASVLEQHFGNFGGIERVVLDGADRGFIKFQDRYAGQNALTRGGMFGQARLQLSWAEVQDAPAELAPPTPVASNGGDAQGDGSNGDYGNDSSEVSASA